MTLFNNTQYKKVIFAGLLAVALLSAVSSCKPKFYEEPTPGTPGAGSADFTTYVAVGSNITAGWMDGVYYTEGQNNAYPNLISAKIKAANSAALFNQPDVNSQDGWAGTGKGRLYFPAPACTSISYTATNVTPGQGNLPPYSGDITQVTNLAVPYQLVSELNSSTVAGNLSTYNTALPYFDRLFTSSTLGTSSEVKERSPTFFTVWYGYQDALRYATSGGTASLISDATFQTNIEKLLDSLLVNNAKGVIALIPYVDLFPVITNNNRRLTSTSDPARMPLYLTSTQAATYNSALGVTFFSGIAGAKNYLAITPGTGAIRAINTSKDFIVRGNLLDSSGIGLRDPNSVRSCNASNKDEPREERGLLTVIANKDVLDKDEIVTLRLAIDHYNQIIRDAVAARNLSGTRIGIVDLNTFYNVLTDPLYGISYSTPTGYLITRANHPSLGPDYGGFYSLDRTYPTPRGQALLANEFIKTINATFGSTLSLYDPSVFRVNVLP